MFQHTLHTFTCLAFPESTDFAVIFRRTPRFPVYVLGWDDMWDRPATASLHELGEEDGWEVV